MQTTPYRFAATLLSLAAGSITLSACKPQDSSTARTNNDRTVAESPTRTEEISAEARQAGREVKEAARDAADVAGNKVKDVAITTEINSRLVRDPQLSALSINVDTADGRVVLRGNAPNTAARTRAAELAKGVDGVVAVNNELSVQPRQ